MKRVAILFVFLTLALSACRAEVGIRLDVAEDGSGLLAADVAINDQLRDLIEQFAGDSETIIGGLDLGLEGERRTSVEEDLTIYTTEVAFDDEESIEEAAAGNFTFVDLEMADDGTSLEATLDVAGELDLSQFPVTPSTIDPETLEAQISVSLPGEVAENNADEITPDGRFVWDIPFEGELYMFATTEYPKAGFPWWLAGLVALAIALALGVWLAAVRREKQGAAVRPPAPEPPPLDTPDPEADTTEAPPRQDSPFFDLD
jgi:hypothetical protein